MPKAEAYSQRKKFAKNSYRPLPKILTIRESGIDGLGLFAVENIKKGYYLGETHFKVPGAGDWLRTPLGGFINHSDNSNAEINSLSPTARGLTTLRDIGKGEEITIIYTLY
ncbi:MAG: SET domain-containing protein [Porticoccaceae bacterium]|nr:SET domain-containing protein [Porticoccaceae bacterium]MDG1475457.1 SET domain-containing protein [Porticoccaceae bacterium]